ncbi:MAG: hypothetical protein REH79_02655 [Spiroplasma sp.]|nr:hypothetical protein [Spiroplasma sp.]
MTKKKWKLAAKLFNQKKDQSQEQQPEQGSDYFHNVVPPITSSLDNNNNLDNKVHDLKNIQVTSSFVIPLNKQSFPNQMPNHQGNNFYHQEPLKQDPNLDQMALLDLTNNFKIPKAISFEIKTEKLRQLMMIVFSLIVTTISSVFIGFYFAKFQLSYTPHPVITIPLVIFTLMISIVNCLDFIALKKEVNLYIERTLKGSLMPPNFIIRNYRKIHARLIIGNWLFTFLYITLGIATLIIWLISGQKITFFVQSWTVTVPNLMTEAVTLLVILGSLFFIHMTSIVFFKKRKNNVLSHYGYEIINPNELEIYKKKINRICMIITISFLAIIFFAIAIPILIVRRRKKKA